MNWRRVGMVLWGDDGESDGKCPDPGALSSALADVAAALLLIGILVFLLVLVKS